MKTLAIWVLLATQIIGQDTTKLDLSFLKNLSVKDQVQKIIDTCHYISNKDPRLTLRVIKKGFELLNKNPNRDQEKFLYYLKAWSYMELSDFKKAKDYAKIAIETNDKQEDYDFLSDYNNLMGCIYYGQSQLDEALEYQLTNLSICEKHGLKANLAISLGNIGNIYASCNENEEALEYYQRASAAYKENNDKPNRAIVNDNMGLIYVSLKRYNEALKYFWEANKLYREVDNITYYYWNFAYLGDVYLKLDDNKNAHKYLNIAFEGTEKYNHIPGLLDASINLGNLYYSEKRYYEALKYLRKAEPLAKENQMYAQLASIYQKISEIYKGKGNYKLAYENYVLYNQFSDSVFTADVDKRIRELDIKYNLEKKENELALMKKNNRLNELELSRAATVRNFLITIFGISTLFFVLLIYFRNKSYRKLKEKQNIINEQKEKLETTNKELIEYQSELQDLNRDLEEKVAEEVKKREAQQLVVMQKSKLESLGIFSAGIAHEINQPLTSISFSVENMIYKKQTDKLTDEYLGSKFVNITEDIKRITNIINHIRVFAREQSNVKFDKFDLNEVVANSQLIVNTQLKNRNINIELKLAGVPLFILGNKYKLEQVLLNFILNSRYAVEKKEALGSSFDFQKRIIVKTWSYKGFSFLSVEDNGIGIPEAVKNKIFEPFFTTKDPEDGSGLGLSIAYGIVKEHNGEIIVESLENEFTKLTIKIPSLN